MGLGLRPQISYNRRDHLPGAAAALRGFPLSISSPASSTSATNDSLATSATSAPAAPGPAAKRPKTRDRILETALALFNQDGFAKVTTARIAAEVGISEGNLWYHFRTKRDLVVALWEQLAESIRLRTTEPTCPDTVLDDFITYSRRTFREMWDFRFLYRDRAEYGRFDEELEQRLRVEVVERGHELLGNFLQNMIKAGHLRAKEAEIRGITVNVWIVVRYWLDYLAESRGITTIEPLHIRAGTEQHLALFLPYLTPGARAYLGARATVEIPEEFAPGNGTGAG